MIGEVTGKVLDATEAGVVRAADMCVSVGAWAVPFCYRRACNRLIGSQQNEADTRKDEEDIVRVIGTMALKARRSDIPMEIEEVQAIARAVGSTLDDGIGYEIAFDPHRTQVLDKLAPLHDENE